MEGYDVNHALFKAHQRIINAAESITLTNSLINTFDILVEYNFSARKAIEAKAISRGTLYGHLNHPALADAIKEIRPLISANALLRVVDISNEADCDSTSLKASTYLLEAYEAETYDAGVRRQLIANKAGDWLQQLIGNQRVPIEVIEEAIESDPFAEPKKIEPPPG